MMTDAFWEKIKKLGDGTVLARVVSKTDGCVSWCRVLGDEVELLDADLLPTGYKCKELQRARKRSEHGSS
jgi:hypothetical protein